MSSSSPPQQTGGTSNDGSFEDTSPFLSSSNRTGGSSWESMETHTNPGRGGKRFDTSTPILIDEEEMDDYEFSTLAHQQQQHHVRRTPGATQMHQSSVGVSVMPLPEQEGVQLGFELGAAAQKRSLTAETTATTVSGATGDDVNRPPLGRASSQTPSSSTSRSLLSPSPWKSPESASRHGAFSPNLYRLTEDIGILLREDEDDDDDFASEIPAVIRGDNEHDTNSDALGDWTGSFVFEQQQPKFTRRTVTRPSTNTKEKARKRGNAQSYVLPHAQHPKPLRGVDEPSFYFDQGRGMDERASPQLLNFSSGAFVPPKQMDMTGSGEPFMYRPVASTPAPSSFQQHQQQQQSYPQFDHTTNNPPPPNRFGFSFQPPVFQSLQQKGAHRFATTPSPTPSTASSTQQQQQQASRMHPHAQVFVPRGSTPQFPTSPSHWSTNTGTTTAYEREWHATQGGGGGGGGGSTGPTNTGTNPSQPSPAFSYGTSYGYASGMPSHSPFDPRAAMTPSPLWPDVMLYPPSTSNPVGSAATATTSSAAAAAAATRNTPIQFVDPAFPPPGMDIPAYLGTSITPTTETQPSQPAVVAPVSAQSATANSGASTASLSGSVDTKTKKTRAKTRGKKKTKSDKPTAPSPSPVPIAAGFVSKKKTTKVTEGPRPHSTSLDGDDVAASTSEGDARKAVLDESPATRLAFKNFYKAFRTEEKVSFQKAETLALQALEDGSLPNSIHYKVYLELADLAKRSNRYVEARRLYQKVCQLQPYASQGWLEFSKLEEECGFMNRVTNILHAGLEYCTYSESLLTRAVKHQERMGNLGNAREILARLKHVGIDKVWRTVLEGALLEARAGNSDMSRRVLKYLMHHVPWYGPLYLEAYKLERDQGHPDDALQVVQRGLEALPRYGPLWFGAFRLYEEMDFAEEQYNLPKTMKMIERAKLNVSKELVWKVHLEAAQMLERTALIQFSDSLEAQAMALVPVRRRLVLTILTCPNNLRWKVWLAAGRVELVINNIDTARALFRRAHVVVQQKSRSSTLLDCARLEEYVGQTDLARAILCKAREEYGSDWKVWLESVLLEIRNCEYARALEIAGRALEIHTGTGRLWATLVQLQHISGNDTAQKLALQRALLSVPKSGEVWCEGGRIHLNPFSATFDLDRARRCLYFAAKFTPQFGDSFVESLRVEILAQWLEPIAQYIWKRTKNSFLPPTGSGNLTKYIFDVSVAVAIARNNKGGGVEKRYLPQTQYREIVTTVRKKLRFESLLSAIDLTDIRLACANADPNYGALWFHCRKLPTDTPRRVIENAAELVARDLFDHAHIYLAAMVRRMAVVTTMDVSCPKYEGIETSDPAVIAWETIIDTRLRDATSLADMLNPVDPTTGLVFLESTSRGSTFVTGLVELSKARLIKDMPLYERRRAVFGTDALLP